MATVTLICLEEPIPFETLIKVQLSLTQNVEDVAVNPTIAVKVSSTVPKFDPSIVTEYEPATDPDSGLADDRMGEKYENNWVMVLDPAPREIETSLLEPEPEGERTRKAVSETHLALGIDDVVPMPGTAEESTNPK